jgi:hypothetical protein
VTDPITFASVAFFALVVGLLASLIPARRASRQWSLYDTNSPRSLISTYAPGYLKKFVLAPRATCKPHTFYLKV